MNNQPLLNKRAPFIQRLAISTLAILLGIVILRLGVSWARMSDPYVRDVLVLPGDRVRGHAIFQVNCAGCHGTAGTGLVGPSLQKVSERKSRVGLIYQVISGKTPPMPKFQPMPQDMADLLRYLESFK